MKTGNSARDLPGEGTTPKEPECSRLFCVVLFPPSSSWGSSNSRKHFQVAFCV